jgi:ubiquitin C-terminal hydrolase
MSELIPYNKKYAIEPNGFVNLGATCYFNSVIQCVLSCTSIMEVLEKNINNQSVKKNKLAQMLIAAWKKSLSGGDITDSCVPIWREIINISQSQNTKIKMNWGQQDAHEGLIMFLSALESVPQVYQLFQHRCRNDIYCSKCKSVVSSNKMLELVFETPADLKNEQLKQFENLDEYYKTSINLQEFLTKNNGYIDAQYKCPKCGDISKEKYQSSYLTMVSEIITIVFKKYEKKHLILFPMNLEFTAKCGTKKIRYKLVAQSEHSGSMSGGHYWAVCLRSDGYYNLNDTMLSKANPQPTENTYLVFYHYIGTY